MSVQLEVAFRSRVKNPLPTYSTYWYCTVLVLCASIWLLGLGRLGLGLLGPGLTHSLTHFYTLHVHIPVPGRYSTVSTVRRHSTCSQKTRERSFQNFFRVIQNVTPEIYLLSNREPMRHRENLYAYVHVL
jgi:hypothetical protein